jgi:hypothetical protein
MQSGELATVMANFVLPAAFNDILVQIGQLAG